MPPFFRLRSDGSRHWPQHKAVCQTTWHALSKLPRTGPGSRQDGNKQEEGLSGEEWE